MALSLLGMTRDSILAPLGLLQYSSSFLFEVIDIIIISLVIGYIFMDWVKKPQKADYDPLHAYTKRASSRWENLKYSAMVVGPAIVFHELAHKFVAMAFGAKAVLYAPYGFYIFVILLKAIGFPFIFLVGAFVSIQAVLTPLQHSIVSFAGPGMNFLLWYGSRLAIQKNWVKKDYLHAAVWFGKLNLLLGIFNMIPIPGFDGFKVFSGLFQTFF